MRARVGGVLSGRRELIAIGVLLAVAAGAYFATAASVENFGSDTSTYFGLARSLRYDSSYSFNYETHTTYPPGHPFLLAGLMWLFGESFVWFVRASIVIAFIGLVGFFLIVRREKGAVVALTAVILLLASSTFYYYPTGGLPSEVPYLAISIWALLVFQIAGRSEKRWVRILAPWMVGGLAGCLVLLRSIGITFTGGLVLWMLAPLAGLAEGSGSRVSRSIERVKRWLPAVVLPLVVFAAWMSFTSKHRPDERNTDYMQSYVRQLIKSDPHQIDSPNIKLYEFPARAAQMLTVRTYHTTRMLLNVRALPFGWKNPLCLIVLAVVALGLLVSLRGENSLAEWYVLGYIGMLLIYPFDEGIRYLYAIQPFLLVFAISGVRAIDGWIQHRSLLNRDGVRIALGAALCSLIVVSGLYQISLRAASNMAPDTRTFENAVSAQVASWIRENTDPEAVIMGDQFPILHRLTGRKALRFPLTTDQHVLYERIESAGVDFIVVLREEQFEYYNPSVERRFRDLLGKHPSKFEPVHSFRNGTVYRVKESMSNESGRDKQKGGME
jgi:hypothetical protein